MQTAHIESFQWFRVAFIAIVCFFTLYKICTENCFCWCCSCCAICCSRA